MSLQGITPVNEKLGVNPEIKRTVYALYPQQVSEKVEVRDLLEKLQIEL